MKTRDLTDTTTAAARGRAGREFAAASLEGGRANHTFGRHIMLDLRRCDEGRLNSLENCFFILDVLPERIGMKKISAPHVFRYEAPDKSESGITGVTIIAESHISLHTFPKKRYAFVDVFSCKSFDGEPVVAFLKEFLLCEEYDVFSQNRGKGFSRNKI